ncbi:MAG: aminotransferase class V-fold PLP-dependent enzyme [Rhodospirillales bacterium]|jgi:cysteine desulfurase
MKGAPLEQRIYLDYQATTPTHPRAVEAMLPWFTERFGNPHSSGHVFGQEAEYAVERARVQLAELIGAEAREIIFTSGATESNNLAIKGAARFHKDRKNHIIVVATEHKCVLEAAKRLEREGFRLTVLPVSTDGMLDLSDLEAALTQETAVVSVMTVNNEIGVIQPVSEIGALCRKFGAYFHTDGAQSVGKIPIDVQAMNIDLMSISGHKVYGPMGIGALYVRRRPRVRILLEMDGGGQERGMRSGTLAPPLCVGFGEAARIADADMAEEGLRLTALRQRMLLGLMAKIDGLVLNGNAKHRLPGNLNITVPGVPSDALMAAVPEVAFSAGSACTSAALDSSYVLRAIGLDDSAAAASIRIGLGRFTTEAEIDRAIDLLVGGVERLRPSGW